METDFLVQKIFGVLPAKRRRAGNGSVNIDCPMCVSRGEPRPDTKLRCGIRTDAGGGLIIHCFNCDFRSRWTPGQMLGRNVREFLSGLGVNDLEIKQLNFTAWKLSQNGETKFVAESPVFSPNFTEATLPPKAQTLSQWADQGYTGIDFLEVVQYALSRGDAVFNATEFYWSPDTANRMNRRLILPFYWNDKIVGWSARAIDKGVLPKYYSDVPGHYLFNNSMIEKDRKFIILVEGVMDALAIEGVSTQGAKLSEQQAYWLNNSGKQIIVLPDRDTAGQALIDLALKHNWHISFPEWGTHIKDANDAVNEYGKLYAVRSIIDSATDNKLKINLARKKF